MAIQPIDLQTLFSQLEKISQQQTHLQQGVQLKNAMQQDELQKKDALRKEGIEEANKLETGPATIKDREGSSGNRPGARSGSSGETEDIPEPKKNDIFTDPSLGNHIDISG
jgi:hypothetical protein